GNGVLAGADALERRAHRGDGRQNADVEAGRIVLAQIAPRALDQHAVVGARLVQPEERGRSRRAGARHRELHPVPDRQILRLAHAPDVAGAHLVLDQHASAAIEDAYRAGGGDLEGLVVRAVLLGCLRHQADVADVAHRRDVIRAVLFAVLDDRLIDARVAAV